MANNNYRHAAQKRAREKVKREKKKAKRAAAQARKEAKLVAKERELEQLLGAKPLVEAVQAFMSDAESGQQPEGGETERANDAAESASRDEPSTP